MIIIAQINMLWGLSVLSLITYTVWKPFRRWVKVRVKLLKHARFVLVPAIFIYVHTIVFQQMSIEIKDWIFWLFNMCGGIVVLFSLDKTLAALGRGSVKEIVAI